MLRDRCTQGSYTAQTNLARWSEISREIVVVRLPDLGLSKSQQERSNNRREGAWIDENSYQQPGLALLQLRAVIALAAARPTMV
jgi:hypothetical protein